jgi:hypothetical protein
MEDLCNLFWPSYWLVALGDCGDFARPANEIDIADTALLVDHLEALWQIVNDGWVIRSLTFRQSCNGGPPARRASQIASKTIVHRSSIIIS